MRKRIFLIVLPALILLAWYGWRQASFHRLRFRAYFQSSGGLQQNDKVAIDGVEVGRVDKISIRSELGDHPIEVAMSISLEDKVPIPADSLARLATHGVLGPTYVDIDTRHAFGPPLRSGETLRTLQVQEMGNPAADLMEMLGTTLIEKSHKMRREQTGDPAGSDPNSVPKKNQTQNP